MPVVDSQWISAWSDWIDCATFIIKSSALCVCVHLAECVPKLDGSHQNYSAKPRRQWNAASIHQSWPETGRMWCSLIVRHHIL